MIEYPKAKMPDYGDGPELCEECAYKQKRITDLEAALGNMLDYYWGYRKNDGAWELSDDIAQKYQDELVEGGRDE